MEENIVKGILESIENGTFERQHDTILHIGKKGKIKADKVIKDGENFEIYNENQRAAYLRKMKKENAMKEHIELNEGGDYVHFVYRYMCPAFQKIEEKYGGNKANIHIIRFIQLATHVSFGNNMYKSHNNRMKKSSLKEIWDVTNRSSIKETYEILKELDYIKETKEGYIMINEAIIKKGDMEHFKKIKKEDFSNTYTRLFSENIQQLYLGTEPKARKQLANLFKILPYVNYRYNTFCENPTEQDINKIIPMTWTDLARICGYEEKKNIAKFKKDLFKLKIYNYNIIGEFKTDNGYEILVNPKIYYSGDDIKDVEYLYSLFKMTLNTKTAM